MDWQALKKSISEQITFSSVTKTLLGAAGALIAIYWKKNVGSITKSIRQFFKRGATILSLQSTISELEKRCKENTRQIFISNGKQMSWAYCSPHPMFITNPKGEATFVNPAFLQMTGITTVTDAFHREYINAIHPSHKDFIEDEIDRLVKYPNSFNKEIIFRHIKTFERITTICRSEPIHDNEGVLIETIWIVSVISTERESL